MRIFYCLIILMTFVGCAVTGEEYLSINYDSQDTVVTDSVRYFDFTEAAVDTFIKAIDYVYLEATEDSYLDRISKLILSPEYIFVGVFYENSGVYIFTHDGSFITSISDFGKGPGEVSYITDFAIDTVNQQIYIGEGGNRRISVFDFDGNFVRNMQTDFNFHKMAYSPELHRYIFYTPHDQDVNSGSRIKITDESFNIISKAFPVDEDKKGLVFDLEGRFFVDEENTVFYNPLLDNKIYTISYDGQIHPILDFEDAEARDELYTNLTNTKQPKKEDLQKFSSQMLISRFMVNSNKMCVRINKEGLSYILIGELGTERKKFYKPTIRLTNVGERFDFVFLEPKSMHQGDMVGVLNADSYMRLLDTIEDGSTISHLELIDPSDNPVVVMYSMNEE